MPRPGPGAATGSGDSPPVVVLQPRPARALPCHVHDPDLWFAASPADLDRAKALCAGCPVRGECLAGALRRGEPWGVWGGEIVEHGRVLPVKRARGRPRNPERTPGRVPTVAGG